MQNPIQKFRQSSIVFEKPGILPEKLKTLTSSNNQRLIIFVQILHTFPTYQCLLKGVCACFVWNLSHVPKSKNTNVCKRVCGLFYFVSNLSYLPKWKKIPGFYTLTETTFINNQDLNKIKKSQTPFCRHS